MTTIPAGSQSGGPRDSAEDLGMGSVNAQNNSPLFTIGIPTVSEDFAQLRLAVQSVLAQTVTDWELVFLCDGCDPERIDQLRAIADPRVRIIAFEERGGIGRSLNRLANEATGRYIAILAADDVWPPDRLELQLPRLERPGAADVVAGQMLVISDDFVVEGMQRRAFVPSTPEGWVAGTPISHATAVARTEWFRAHPYDEALVRAQDRAFWITAHRGSRIEIMDEILYYYRVPRAASYKKYAWSSRFARRVIWKYGPLVTSRPRVARIFLTSYLKQLVVLLSVPFGGVARLYDRRLEPGSSNQWGERVDELRSIARVEVPGWQH